MRIFYGMLACLLLNACSGGQEKGATEAQVSAFHRAYGSRQFEAIYDAATPAFKGVSSKAKFLEFMAAVYGKLGPVRSATPQTWHVNYGTGGTHVTLAYQTTFSKGTGVETFVYKAEDVPRLVSYHINSDALVLR